MKDLHFGSYRTVIKKSCTTSLAHHKKTAKGVIFKVLLQTHPWFNTL